MASLDWSVLTPEERSLLTVKLRLATLRSAGRIRAAFGCRRVGALGLTAECEELADEVSSSGALL